ncbi:MAG: acyl-CoA desaturase [Planctomycetes bacterium]|nr:acyl-CoA desaturase [Planctomycetota bacterium]
MPECDTELVNTSAAHKLLIVVAVALPFLGCIAAITLMWFAGWMSWLYLGLFLGGWIITALGITIGFHRLLSHRSFESPSWVRAFWTSLGSIAGQGPPLVWCAMHRKHHERSDQPGDPHSPHQHGEGFWKSIGGFIHSHMGWLFTVGWNTKQTQRYVPDLLKDRVLVGINRYYFFWILLGLVVPAAIGFLIDGGWQGALLGLLWGGLARMFFLHHITWSVNSVCHVFGRRDYESADLSTNNFLIGLLAHGEGWHNNHHAFPTSARHGLKWWQFDLSWLVIRGMQFCGLARKVITPSRTAMAAKRLSD